MSQRKCPFNLLEEVGMLLPGAFIPISIVHTFECWQSKSNSINKKFMLIKDLLYLFYLKFVYPIIHLSKKVNHLADNLK